MCWRASLMINHRPTCSINPITVWQIQSHLSLSLFYFSFANNLGIYLTAVMAITSISVVMTVIVLNCHYKGPTAKQVPHWVRRYVKTSRPSFTLFRLVLAILRFVTPLAGEKKPRVRIDG